MAATSICKNVKQFDRNGYSNWEYRVKLVLEQNEVLDVLESEPPTDATELVAFKKKDFKARNIILQCLFDNVLEMIKGKKYAKEIIEELKGRYVNKGIASLVQLQNKLRNMKFKGKESLSDFIILF